MLKMDNIIPLWRAVFVFVYQTLPFLFICYQHFKFLKLKINIFSPRPQKTNTLVDNKRREKHILELIIRVESNNVLDIFFY